MKAFTVSLYLDLSEPTRLLRSQNIPRYTLVEELGISAEKKISVVYPIVDPGFFKPQGVPVHFRTRYRLSHDMQYILYVGTNDPRKNFNSLIQAFALLQQRYPKVRLIKVGADPFPRQSGANPEVGRAVRFS